MLDLPHEIWLHIAHFIKPSFLQDLIGLNSTFYDIAMDCRYRQITFAFLDNKMLRNLVRLKDPVVARRVRVLHVHPGFLDQVLESSMQESNGHRRPFRSRLADFIEQRFFPGPKKPRPLPKLRTGDDILDSILAVFSGLPNVTDYHISWCGLPHIPESPVPLLAAVFRPNLRKLSLDISLENLLKLFRDPALTLGNIQELSLIIRLDDQSDSITIYHLAPAISRLYPTLRQLTLQTWGPLDLCPFFHDLSFLPHLTHLALAIPIDAPHFGDPCGLSALLQRQASTLRSLSFRASQDITGQSLPIPCALRDWVSLALANVTLPNLRELSISSRHFPFSAALVCLHRLSPTITSLSLTGAYHPLWDIITIVAAFRGRPRYERLERLYLGTVTLTPYLLDFLARELPELYELELILRGVAPFEEQNLIRFTGTKVVSGADLSAITGMVLTAPSFSKERFLDMMDNRRYSNWHLRRFKYTITPTYCHFSPPHFEQSLKHSIPAIRCFS